MGSLYVVESKRKYRAFTFMCTQEYKNKIDDDFVQGILDDSWPINTIGGDIQGFAKSKDGEVGDIAALTIITEGTDDTGAETISRETKLYIRNAPGVGATLYLWTDYVAPEIPTE